MPLFVTFLAAIIGAFAAFLVWIELLMRDAAVYVVALFTPLALAASIWPRWSGAMRRTGELLVVVIGSKFVIVSIIALAAGLVSESGSSTEHILAAAALMLLACFAPFVLLKLVPFAEGAMSAAYSRRSAGGGAMSGLQMASDVQILRNMARSNWGESGQARAQRSGTRARKAAAALRARAGRSARRRSERGAVARVAVEPAGGEAAAGEPPRRERAPLLRCRQRRSRASKAAAQRSRARRRQEARGEQGGAGEGGGQSRAAETGRR